MVYVNLNMIQGGTAKITVSNFTVIFFFFIWNSIDMNWDKLDNIVICPLKLNKNSFRSRKNVLVGLCKLKYDPGWYSQNYSIKFNRYILLCYLKFNRYEQRQLRSYCNLSLGIKQEQFSFQEKCIGRSTVCPVSS